MTVMYLRVILVLLVGASVHSPAEAQRVRRQRPAPTKNDLVRPSVHPPQHKKTELFQRKVQKAALPRKADKAQKAQPSKSKPDHAAILAQPEILTFKRQFQAFNRIGSKDNRQFISQLAARSPKGRLFYLAENAILKRLNDSIIKDKDLVTSACNAYKEILLNHLLSDPVLHQALEGRYSDYKAIAFVFKKDSPDVHARLGRAHEAAGKEFHTLMNALPSHALYQDHRGIVGKPEAWHLGGIGKSADLASLAARYARSRLGSKLGATIAEFRQASKVLSRRVDRAEVLRSEIHRKLGGASPLLALAGSGSKKVLSPAAIELLRKAEGGGVGTTALLRRRFQERFGVVLSKKVIHKLQRYFSLVDSFSSSLFLEKRVVINFAEATHGVVSVDFAGQGVKNHFQNQLALLRSVGQGSVVASEQARRAEVIATDGMQKLKGHFEGALEGSFGPRQHKRVRFSGDDGIFMPAKEPTLTQKRAFLKSIAEKGGTGSFRVTFLPSHFSNTKTKIRPEHQSLLIVTAENIEKKVRSTAEGRIPFATLSKIMIGVDLQPRLGGGGTVNLLLAGTKHPGLTAKLKDSITKALPPGYKLGRIDFH